MIKFLGAGYLIYIGWKSLRTKPIKITLDSENKKTDIEKFAAIKMGFLTNILNPKATLFFLSLFTQVINPETPTTIKILYGMEMSLTTFVWFALVATALSQEKIKVKLSAIQHHFEKVFGIILIALGIKVALSNTK